MAGLTTRAIHTRFAKKDSHGSLHMPVYDSVSFEFDTAEEIENAFMGRKYGHMYSRISNPTVEHFEQKILAITEAYSVLAVSSGMAAISTLLLAIARNGDSIITTKHLFGNTYSLFERTMKPWGLTVKYADLNKLETLENLFDKTTRAIFLETITNPQLEVADIEKLAAIAKRHKILVVVDTTITPLFFLNAKSLGIDIEVLSSTKYISGGATSVGGLIVDYGTYDWENNPKLADDAQRFVSATLIVKLRKEVFRNFGPCLSPHNAYLQSLGLETMVLRAEASCANSLAIAEYLHGNAKIARVNYPGLKDSPHYQIVCKQFGHRCGAMLTFDLNSKEECFRFMNKLQFIRRATNINDNKTLILHPASTIFCEYDPKLRTEMGVRDTMIRLSVGIEDKEDLISDISQALETI